MRCECGREINVASVLGSMNRGKRKTLTPKQRAEARMRLEKNRMLRWKK